MADPIITHHLSPYHSVQGTAADVEKITGRIAHIRHVYGDADPDAALIERLKSERDAAQIMLLYLHSARPEVMRIALEIAAEVERAERKHKPLNSPHEAWSVIFEEVEELREHVRADTGRSAEARKEAIQVGAMGLRYALNLCETDMDEAELRIIGMDLAKGGDTHVEGYWQGGVLHVTEIREATATKEATSVQDAAQRLLSAYDASMSGEGATPDQRTDAAAVRLCAAYGAAAFMAAPDQDHGAHAMARAFLLALIDPLHPDLDYLRADPAAGQVARDARDEGQ